MKRAAWIAPCLVLLLSLSGCSDGFFERQDKKTVQSQLHLPDDTAYLSFQSDPRSLGSFGREGLWIRAEIQLTEEQFEAYVAHLDDPAVWKPVAFGSYSPSVGESYSNDALRWQGLPLPDSIRSLFRDGCATRPDLIDAKDGRYYCSVIAVLQVAPPSQDGQSPYDWRAAGWRYVGRAFTELPGPDPDARVVTMVLAVLDFETRRMSVYVRFAG